MIAFSFGTHWRFGVVFWAILAIGGIASNPITALIGSILPDSDHKRSPIGRIFPIWLIAKHRGWTHTIWGLLLFGGLTWILFGWWSAAGMLIGYASHLLLDSCTPAGVYLFGKRKDRR